MILTLTVYSLYLFSQDAPKRIDDYDPFDHENFKTLETFSDDEDDEYNDEDDEAYANKRRFGVNNDADEGRNTIALYDEPRMDNTSEEDVWVVLGKPVDIHCQVRNLGERAVSDVLFRLMCSEFLNIQLFRVLT